MHQLIIAISGLLFGFLVGMLAILYKERQRKPPTNN